MVSRFAFAKVHAFAQIDVVEWIAVHSASRCLRGDVAGHQVTLPKIQPTCSVLLLFVPFGFWVFGFVLVFV